MSFLGGGNPYVSDGLGGAASGAAAGSVFGPPGTAIGAGVGLLGGLYQGYGADRAQGLARRQYGSAMAGAQNAAQGLAVRNMGFGGAAAGARMQAGNPYIQAMQQSRYGMQNNQNAMLMQSLGQLGQAGGMMGSHTGAGQGGGQNQALMMLLQLLSGGGGQGMG